MNVSRAFIGLGANLGDPAQAFAAARAAIAALPATRVLRASSLYRSSPVQAIGPDFLNQVVLVETGLCARALLDALLQIERQAGRDRPFPNAPRTLDLDLLLYGNDRDAFVTLDEAGPPSLQLPHPRMHVRRFVLEPLIEITPTIMIPGHGAATSALTPLRADSTQNCVRIETPQPALPKPIES